MISPLKERHYLTAGTGVVGSEGDGASAGGDAVFHRPHHGLIVESTGTDVGKRALVCADRRFAGSTPQEGDHLAAGTAVLGGEGGGAGTGGDTVGDGPHDRVVVESALLHVGEGVADCIGVKEGCSGTGGGDRFCLGCTAGSASVGLNSCCGFGGLGGDHTVVVAVTQSVDFVICVGIAADTDIGGVAGFCAGRSGDGGFMIMSRDGDFLISEVIAATAGHVSTPTDFGAGGSLCCGSIYLSMRCNKRKHRPQCWQHRLPVLHFE